MAETAGSAYRPLIVVLAFVGILFLQFSRRPLQIPNEGPVRADCVEDKENVDAEATADEDAVSEDDASEDVARLAKRTRSSTSYGERRPSCDNCAKKFLEQSDAFFYCSICERGDFDLCQECVDQGFRCFDASHDTFDASHDTIKSQALMKGPFFNSDDLSSRLSNAPGIKRPPDKNGKAFRSDLPDWFFNSCVYTSEELKEAPPLLVVRNGDDDVATTSPHDDSGRREDRDKESENMYEMDDVFLEPLYSLISSHTTGMWFMTGDSRPVNENTNWYFKHDSVLLRFPTMTKPGISSSSFADEFSEDVEGCGSTFLRYVVRHFARSIGADLVTLTMSDIEDLLWYLEVTECLSTFKDLDSYGLHSLKSSASKKKKRRAKLQIDLLFRLILGCSSDKKSFKGTNDPLTRVPALVVLLEDVRSLCPGNDGELSYAEALKEVNLLERFRDAAARCSVAPSKVLFIASDMLTESKQGRTSQSDREILNALGKEPVSEVLEVVPINSMLQRSLLAQDLENEKRQHETKRLLLNALAVQSAIHRLFPESAVSPPLTPGHDHIQSGRDANDAEILKKVRLSKTDIHLIIEEMGSSYSLSLLIHVASRLSKKINPVLRRQELTDAWTKAPRNGHLHSGGFPLDVQRKIEKLKKDGPDERALLKLIIYPTEIAEGWDDIALDEETGKALKQMTKKFGQTARGIQPYGVFKRKGLGGVLLYGPPGTGKTQLARVLAKEIGVVTFCASYADIETEFVGDTEKKIQKLFRIARELHPSLIFIDEAESLFRARAARDSGWEISRKTQFLAEMDGLKRSKDHPFVVLACNLPQMLDQAVLRRLPSRFYIGLPSEDLRREIFQIHLAGEQCDVDVEISELASRTDGFSGSDIESLCQQAAIVCEAMGNFVPEGPQQGKRLIRWTHFEDAFSRVSESVSMRSLWIMRDFAQEFDPQGHHKIIEWERAQAERQRARQERGQKMTGDGTAESRIQGLQTNKISRPHFAYAPYTLGKTQIRVLSIEQPDSDKSSNEPGLISCHLETVDLEDWTTTYQEWLDRTTWFCGMADARPSDVEDERIFDQAIPEGGLNLMPPEKEKVTPQKDGSLRDLASTSGVRQLTLCLWLTSVSIRIGCGPDFDLDYEKLYWEAFDKHLAEKGSADGSPPFLSESATGPTQPCTDVLMSEDRFTWGDYLALSYVWGDLNSNCEILLNGALFKVTTNLHQALRQLRMSQGDEIRTRKLRVWIDAICINQGDPEEKAKTVERMGSIFKGALCVRGWVGQPATLDAPMISQVLGLLRDVRLIRQMTDGGSDIGDHLSSAHWRSIQRVGTKFLSERYWERVWIMQEMYLATQINFWYGDNEFTTGDILHLGQLMQHEYVVPSLEVKYNIRRLEDLRRRDGTRTDNGYRPSDFFTRNLFADVTNLVELIHSSKATEQRDKVYGFHALLPDAVRDCIKPKYGSGGKAAETYTKFSKAWIEYESSLNLLARVNIYNSERHIPNQQAVLPSWVVDLETPQQWFSVRTLVSEEQNRSFHADKGYRSLITFADNDRSLICSGLIIDTIDGTGQQKLIIMARNFSGGVITRTNVQLGSSLLRMDLPAYSINDAHHPDQLSLLEMQQPQNVSLILTPDNKAKLRLSLARTLLLDANYQSIAGSSPVDLPWVEENRPDRITSRISSSDMIPNEMREILSTIFWGCNLWENERFNMGGMALKDYFVPSRQFYDDPDTFKGVLQKILDTGCHVDGMRKFLPTHKGLIGRGPFASKPGDKIAILIGCQMPVVLRKRPDDPSAYQFIGSCFIDGYMKGEALEGIDMNSEEGRSRLERIVLR